MQIYGHRGAKGEAPENTEAGFRFLRDLGIHHVELDVRLSKDDDLIVLHDKTVDRTAYGTGNVASHRTHELASLDARKTTPHWPVLTGIPTLKSVLRNWPELRSIQLEVKATDVITLRQISQKLHQLIEETEIEEQAIITSSHKGFLKISRKQGNHIAHGFVAKRLCRNPIGIVRNLHCQYLCAHHKLLTAQLVTKAHSHGIYVSAWTVNKLDDAFTLAKMDVDSIITDFPSHFV